MIKDSGVALALCSLLASGAAVAQTTYTIDKVTITGSKSVPVDELMSVVQEHRGSRVTTSDIIADQGAIEKLLETKHVVGGIKTSMASKPGNHIEVTFALNDNGVEAPVVTKVAPKLHQEVFAGNASEASDKLAAASGLKPGDTLSNEKIVAAQKAIVAVYSAAKLPISVSVGADVKSVSKSDVDIVWNILETKGKKKRNTEDAGVKLDQ